MASIIVDLSDDIKKLQSLKAEIQEVKKELGSINVNVHLDIKRDMEAKLKSLTSQYDALVQKVSEAEGKVIASTQRINQAAEKIIKAQEQLAKVTGAQPQTGNASSGANAAAANAETASVQAQAKAYDELRGTINESLGTFTEQIRRWNESTNAIRLYNKELKEIKKTQSERNTDYTDAEIRRMGVLNSAIEANRQKRNQASREMRNQIKIYQTADGSLNQLRAQLIQMKNAYAEMSDRGTKEAQEMLASIQQANAKISEIEQSMGVYSRNVGNYASGWNGLSMSIQQVGRELPSLAMGWNTFFLAISNNLPILSDELARARKEYNELKAAGQQATPVWKQVVSSLLSWQTALTVGITLLTLYGKEMVEWIGGLFKAKSSVESLDKQMRNLNDEMKSNDAGYGKNIVALKSLAEEWRKLGDIAQKTRWIEDNQSEFNKLGISISNVRDAENAFVSHTDDIIEAFRMRAQAAAASSLAEEKYREALIKRNQADIESAKGPSASDRAKASFSQNMPTGGGIARIPKISSYEKEAKMAEEIRKKRIQGIYDEAEAAEKAGNAYFQLYETKKKEADDILSGLGLEAELETEVSSENIMKSYFDELSRIREDNEDRQIELMQEGTDKEVAEIELRYKRIREKVQELEKNLYNSQGGKLTQEQSVMFNIAYTGIDNLQSRDVKSATEDAAKKRIDAEREAMNEYLKEYGTYQQKRLAITEEYQQKISKAETEGEKLLLQKQMEEALSGIDMDELKESINWELVFSDLGNVSKKSLQQIKKQLGDFKESAEYKDMGMEQKKVVDEALNNIQSAIIDKGGLLGDLPTQLEELRKAQEDLTQAQEEYNKALAEGTDEQKETARKKLNKSQQGVQNAQQNVERSTKTATDNLLTLADAITQLGGNSEITLSEIGQLAGGIADTFAEAGSKIGGIIGAIFTLLDQIGKQGLDGFLENVFSSVGSALYGVFDTLLGWGGFDFGGESDPTLERDIERLTTANQELEKAINNLSDKMDESSLAEALDIYEVQKENIQKMMANTRDMMRRSVTASSDGFLGIGGHHSSGYKIDNGMSAQDWEAISKVIGRQINGAGEFFMLSSEEMWKVANEATTEYAKLKELADDGYKDAAQFMDEYIGYWQELENLENEYSEKLTSVSFDTIRNDFRNALLGMEDDAEAFSENFEKMMKDAVLESMMTEKYDKRLKDWYKLFSGYMEGGYLGEGEQDDLRDEWQGIVNDALEEWKHWQKIMGWDTESSANQQQSASSGGYETMTQDQSSELIGRFTAFNESSLRQEAIQQGISDIADDMRNIIAQSYIELQQISENTGDSAKYLKDIKADISIVKQNTSRI